MHITRFTESDTKSDTFEVGYGMSLGKHSDFTLFRHSLKNGNSVWYARFWDRATQRYSKTVSTGVIIAGKKERRDEAIAASYAMLPKISFSSSALNMLFVDYVESFWTPESPYVKERALITHKPLSSYYIKMNHDDVARHIRAFNGFKGLKLDQLRSGHIRDWMTWVAEAGLGPRRINSILSAMRVAVRYIVEREEIDRDPFLRIKEAAENPKERGILTHEEIIKSINIKNYDIRGRLAFLLGVLCGMRRGEVRGLQWGDLDFNNLLIHISHNYLDEEGLKTPKRDSVRTVPMPSMVKAILQEVLHEGPFSQPGDFVLFNIKNRYIPVGNSFLRTSFYNICLLRLFQNYLNNRF